MRTPHTLFRSISVGVITVTASSAMAQVVDPNLPGNTQSDTWLSINSSNYPGIGSGPTNFGLNPWAVTSSGGSIGHDGSLNKTAGQAYAAGGSLYAFYSGGSVPNTYGATFSVTDTTPLANLATVVLQVRIGEAYTYDFFNHALPTLSYNGGGQSIAAGITAQPEHVQIGNFGDEPVYLNTWLLQWDLTGVSGPITSLSLNWTAVRHSQTYDIRLDQSDVFTPVPAPGALGLLAGVALLRRRRD